jgi:hypothetical protein
MLDFCGIKNFVPEEPSEDKLWLVPQISGYGLLKKCRKSVN